MAQTTPGANGSATGPCGRVWDLNAHDPSARDLDFQSGKNSQSGFGYFYDLKGKWVAIASQDLAPKCWDLSATETNFRALELPPGEGGALKNLVISRDGRRLVACLQDGKARVWDLEHPDRKPRDIDLHGLGEVASTLATDSDGRWAVTTGSAPKTPPPGDLLPPGPLDETVRLWDLSDPDIGKRPIILRVSDLRGPSGLFMGHLVVSDDEKWLASRTNRGLVVWKLDRKAQDPAKPIVPFEKEPAAANIRAFTFNADSKSLWIAGLNVVCRGDLTSRSPLQVPLILRGHDGPIAALTVSRDSRRLITGGADGTARLWDLDAPQRVGRAR